jgi:MFS transporter, UMF1 family
MYDFATQGYQVTTASALLPAYYAAGIAPEGVAFLGGTIPAEGMWGFGVGIAAILVFLMAPVLGAIADYTFLKKRFLMAFAYGGSLFASVLFFATPGAAWFAIIFFVLAQTFYTAGNVFYDAFLPQIASDQEMDRISGLGFAFGYAGGFLQFAIALGLVSGHAFIGLSEVMAIRLALLLAGLWWLGFALYTFRHLREHKPANHRPYGMADVPAVSRAGIRRTIETFRQLPRFPAMMLFLAAFFFYNDGIQTVISIAGVYGAGTLQIPTVWVMVTFLIVQFIAIFGAMLFSLIANAVGTRNGILIALVIWCGVVIYAYFLRTGDIGGYILLGCIVGLVLGGSQALSRSLFASIIPRNAAAGLFGFFSVFNKLSAILGPLIFGWLTIAFGSARPAVLAIIAFFVIGTILLALVDVEAARDERGLWQFAAAEKPEED